MCMATIRRIVVYKIFINKQVKHTMLTIRLALYIFYNTVQSRLDSSQCNACGRCLYRVASNVHLTKMRSVPLIFRRRRLPLVHRLPPGGDL